MNDPGFYHLTERDYPLLLAAGFESQGMFWDLLWSSDLEGNMWQVSCDEHELLLFYPHDKELRRGDSRPMSRQEFSERFGL